MVKYPTILNLPQPDINRQLYEMLLKAEAGDAAAIQALANKVGSETTANTILYRIKTLETTVGSSSSGLVKDVADLESTVGDSDSGLVKNVADITTAIGDEETADSILGRIKALETAT